MARPTLDNFQTIRPAVCQTYSWTHTVNAGSNNCIVVLLIHPGTNYANDVTVNCDGTAMTRLGADYIPANSYSAEIWYRAGVSAAGHTIQVTDTTDSGNYYMATSSSWFNVNQTTPMANRVTEYGSNTSALTATAVVTNTTNDVIVGIAGIWYGGNPVTKDASSTQLSSALDADGGYTFGSAYRNGPGGNTSIVLNTASTTNKEHLSIWAIIQGTVTTQTYSQTSTAGGLGGSSATLKRGVKKSSAAGGISGGVAGPKAGVRAASAAGAVAGSTAGQKLGVKVASTAGAVLGGLAVQKNGRKSLSSAGAVAGGSATSRLTRHWSQSSTSGALAGGTATVILVNLQVRSYSSVSGAVTGGATAVKCGVKASGASGSVAGGSRIQKSGSKQSASGGAVSGGTSGKKAGAKVRGSSGALAGGTATVKGQYGNNVVTSSTGGAVASGVVLVVRWNVQQVVTSSLGGAVAGSTAVEKRGFNESGTGGALAGGLAQQKRSRTFISASGAIVGGVARLLRLNRISGVGGAIAGGAIGVLEHHELGTVNGYIGPSRAGRIGSPSRSSRVSGIGHSRRVLKVK